MEATSEFLFNCCLPEKVNDSPVICNSSGHLFWSKLSKIGALKGLNEKPRTESKYECPTTFGGSISVSACNVGDLGSIPGWGRLPAEGNGNPLQYSWLENLHGQRSLVGCSTWGRKELDTTERLSTAQPFLGIKYNDREILLSYIQSIKHNTGTHT